MERKRTHVLFHAGLMGLRLGWDLLWHNGASRPANPDGFEFHGPVSKAERAMLFLFRD
ncbi:hypothetical protein AA102526_2202 [Asaia lannensis NBRC 102526]|nr:hypothetical protein AA102526_2202 [Asaia lannensis NBRC 102526]